MRDCATCSKHVTIGHLINCTTCHRSFHYTCVGIGKNYYLANRSVLDRTWICQDCTNVTRRAIINDDTPVRSLNKNPVPAGDQDMSTDEQSEQSQTSILGDTLNISSPKIHKPPTTHPKPEITINQIEDLLDRKLNNIKSSLLSELISAMTTITSAQITKLKLELQKTTTDLASEQENQKKDTEEINNRIIHLNIENIRLQKEIQNIQKSINDINKIAIHPSEKYTRYDNNDKKIVLYGLEEYRGENSQEVYERVVFAFQNILNIDIQGYVEELKRLGKKGHKRPLQIELLSKNLTRQILQNRKFFKNSGLAVSEVLGDESLKHRKKLVEIMIEARRQGQKATIINNKLIINGKEHDIVRDSRISSLNDNQITRNNETRTPNISPDRQSEKILPVSQSQSNFRNF